MSSEILNRDQNHITVLAGVTDDSDLEVKMLRVDPISKRLLVKATVTGASSLQKETPTGTVNGSNTTFTVTNTPIFVISDKQAFFASTGGIIVTGSGPYTIEIDTAPWNAIASFYND